VQHGIAHRHDYRPADRQCQPDRRGNDQGRAVARRHPDSADLYREGKGYFTQEGIDCEIVAFDAALPVSVAVVSGDIDVAVNGLTAGFYKLVSQGALRIIAGYGSEAPTFRAQAAVASKAAYAVGLTGPAALGGHSVAISQIGGASHYILGLLAVKYGFDLTTVLLMPVQTNPNAATAVAGGRADAAVVPGRYLMPALNSGGVKLLTGSAT
jgi:NitT/TauT family transport system substrate-binding protein